MLLALIRAVPRSIADCELTHLERVPIDLARAAAQHHDYVEALATLGCTIEELPRLDDNPDSVFVEDAAVVLDQIAVITRPGAVSRRSETDSAAAALATRRRIVRIDAPATLDGGDVLVAGRRIFVGQSGRSNAAAIAQLREAVRPFDYRVEGVPLSGCLHLKSAATLVAPGTLIVNPDWVDAARFDGLETIAVDRAEPFAANALLVGTTVVYPAAFPATASRLARRGITLQTIDASELAKAEGGVTCCSILMSV